MSLLAKTLLVYSLAGFLLVPAALHFGIYYFSPRFLVEPLRIGAVHFNPFTLKLSLQSLMIGTADQPLVGFRELTVDTTWNTLTGSSIEFDSIYVDNPFADIQLMKGGQVNLAGLLRKEPAVENEGNKSDKSSLTEPDSSTVTPVFLHELSIQNGHINFVDAANTEEQPFKAHLSDFTVTGHSLSWPSPDGTILLNSRVNEEGAIAVKGSLEPGTPGTQETKVTADITVTKINLPDIQPYITPLTYLKLESGRLTGRVQSIWRQNGNLTATVGGEVSSLALVDERDQKTVAGWERLAVAGVSFNQDQKRLRVDSVELHSPQGTVVIDEDLQVNLAGLMKPIPSEPVENMPASSSGNDSETAFEIDVNAFQISNGSLNFSDASFKPGFTARITGLSGDIQNLHTHSEEPAGLKLEGIVDSYSPVTIGGTVNVVDPLQATAVNMAFNDVELTTLTPYSGRFAGYRIEKGRMDLDLDYALAARQLDAGNRVLLKQLNLGEEVDSEESTGLPLKLAIALLKDSEGNIDIDLPISGDLDNPEFELGPVIRTAVVNFITNVVTAPFKFLASLVSGDEDEMSSVVFAPGEMDLSERHHQAMANLAKALLERPQLELEVESWAVADIDGPIIARKALEQVILQEYLKREKAAGRDINDNAPVLISVPEDVRLEILYQLAAGQGIESTTLEDEKGGDSLVQVLLEQWTVTDTDLRKLAISRAKMVKEFLVEQGLDARRIYILDVKTGTPEKLEKDGVTTVLNLTVS